MDETEANDTTEETEETETTEATDINDTTETRGTIIAECIGNMIRGAIADDVCMYTVNKMALRIAADDKTVMEFATFKELFDNVRAMIITTLPPDTPNITDLVKQLINLKAE